MIFRGKGSGVLHGVEVSRSGRRTVGRAVSSEKYSSAKPKSERTIRSTILYTRYSIHVKQVQFLDADESEHVLPSVHVRAPQDSPSTAVLYVEPGIWSTCVALQYLVLVTHDS
jgi:hypothetical protein